MSNNTNTLFWIITGAVIVLSAFLLINTSSKNSLTKISNKFSNYVIDYKLKNTDYYDWDREFVSSLDEANEGKMNKVYVYKGGLYIVNKEATKESFEVGKTYNMENMNFEFSFPDNYIDIVKEYYDNGTLEYSQNFMYKADLISGHYTASQTTGNTIYVNYMTDWLVVSVPNKEYDQFKPYEKSRNTFKSITNFTSCYKLVFTITELNTTFPFWEYVKIVSDPVYSWSKIA